METPTQTRKAAKTAGKNALLFSYLENFHTMNKLKLVVAGLALAAAITVAPKPASATPSTLGFYPSTDIYGKGAFHYDADAYTKSNLKDSVFISSGLTYGIGPETDAAFGRTEIGFDYNLTSGGDLSIGKRLIGNVKTQLFNDTKAQTRVVAGLWGLGNKKTNPNYIYLLGSKNFDFGRVHLGVAHATNKDIITNGRTSLQLGYDKYITPKLQFAVDYYSGKGAASGVQPTLYYYINEKANFGLGYFRLNDGDLSPQNQLYICFDYNFDFAKTAEVVAPAPAPETNPANPAAN